MILKTRRLSFSLLNWAPGELLPVRTSEPELQLVYMPMVYLNIDIEWVLIASHSYTNVPLLVGHWA